MSLHPSLRVLLAIARTSALASGSAIALLAANVLAQPLASSPPGIRLPAWVIPIEYDARLVVDPAQETFSGTISIRVRIERTTDVVWLNANNLEISEARIASGAGQGEKAAVEIVPGDTPAEDHDALARSFGPRAAHIEGAEKSLAEVLERIDICLEYRKLQRPSLDAFLRENMAGAQRAAGR